MIYIFIIVLSLIQLGAGYIMLKFPVPHNEANSPSRAHYGSKRAAQNESNWLLAQNLYGKYSLYGGGFYLLISLFILLPTFLSMANENASPEYIHALFFILLLFPYFAAIVFSRILTEKKLNK